jgi:hypothetical protein
MLRPDSPIQAEEAPVDAIDSASRGKDVASALANEAVAQVSAHPNEGGNHGGFGGATKGYVPSAEEVAEMERIRILHQGA